MPLLEDVANSSALEMASALRKREVKSVDLANFCIEKAEAQCSPVFLKITHDRAMREAAAADSRLDKGKPLSRLDGVPLAWKDLFDMQGEISTAGSIIYRHRGLAEKDAAAVAIASSAGLVSIGKLNMTELAFSGIGDNLHFGTPFSELTKLTGHIPGGSSSGSAVAVADKIVPIAIGSDTGGSVRLPSAFNGVIGLKTSEKRYPTCGMTHLSKSMDTIGPIARTVKDCDAIDSILCPLDTNKETQKDQIPKFYIPQNVVLDDLDQEVEDEFNHVIEIIKDAGFMVEHIEIPAFEMAFHAMKEYGMLVSYEAWHHYKDIITDGQFKGVHPYTRHLIQQGQHITDSDADYLRQMQIKGRHEISECIGDGFLLYPTTPILPPNIKAVLADQKYYHRTNIRCLRNTTLNNQFDMPGLAMPMGCPAKNQPRLTSLQISAISGRDKAILKIAEKINILICQ